MELETLPDAGLVQDTDQLLVSRAGAARRAAGAKFTRNDAQGNTQLAGNPRLALGSSIMAGTRAMIGATADYVTVTGGPSGTLFSNALGNATLLSISDAGAINAPGTLNIVGAIRQNGQQVWHSGNFNPSVYAPLFSPQFTGPYASIANSADEPTYFRIFTAGVLRGYFAADLNGTYIDSHRGPIFFQFNAAAPSISFRPDGSADFNSLRTLGNPVWHAGNFNPNGYMPVSGGTFSGGVAAASFSTTGTVSAFDANFRMSQDGNGNPTLVVASGGNWYGFNRAGVFHDFLVNGVSRMQIGSAGVNILGSGSINGQSIWHAGNFNPAAYAAVAGATFTGPVDVNAPIRQNGQQVWHSGNFNPSSYQLALGYVPANRAGDTFAGPIASTGSVTAGSDGFKQATFTSGARNPIWRFGNADAFGISYFQGAAGNASLDTIGFHFGTSTAAGSQLAISQDGTVSASGPLKAPSILRNGFAVWDAGNFNPSSYAVRGADVTFRDVTVSRGDGTGVVYFADGGTYCYFDGTYFVFSKGGVVVAKINENEARFRGNVIGNLGGAV